MRGYPDDERRYARHRVLPEIGEAGQAKLLSSSALVVGAGGLGAAALGYLAAMGVGRIGIADHDRVELSNLQRQLLFETADVGRLKVDAAADRIGEINPGCAVESHAVKLEPANALALVGAYDIALDCTDNFAARFALSDACLSEKKTLVSAAISGFEGQLSVFKAHLGPPHPCYRCLVAHTPPRQVDCVQEGMLGALAGVMGSMQAVEAVKELLGVGQSLSGRLLLYDALAARPRTVLLPRESTCPACGIFSSSS